MARNTIVTEQPVVLEGYQAVLKPGKFGYKLMAVVPQEIADKLEEDRVDSLKWCESKLKNPKRAVCKPEPWEEVSEGMYQIKFSWNEDTKLRWFQRVDNRWFCLCSNVMSKGS